MTDSWQEVFFFFGAGSLLRCASLHTVVRQTSSLCPDGSWQNLHYRRFPRKCVFHYQSLFLKIICWCTSRVWFDTVCPHNAVFISKEFVVDRTQKMVTSNGASIFISLLVIENIINGHFINDKKQLLQRPRQPITTGNHRKKKWKHPKTTSFFFWVGFGEQKKSSIKKGLVSPKWRFKELNGIFWLKTKGQKKAGNPTHHESLKTKEGLLCFFGGIFSSLCSSIRSTYKLIFFLMIFLHPFFTTKNFWNIPYGGIFFGRCTAQGRVRESLLYIEGILASMQWIQGPWSAAWGVQLFVWRYSSTKQRLAIQFIIIYLGCKHVTCPTTKEREVRHG